MEYKYLIDTFRFRGVTLANNTHVDNFTGYMGRVYKYIETKPRPLKILDMPAGNGLLAAAIRRLGHEVICGDINDCQEHYVKANMEERLPFKDEEFDAVICLEGIEHVIDPASLASELSRVCKKDGEIIVSTPNVQSVFSRLIFLFTGNLYLFEPCDIRPIAPESDRGHISPASYLQLWYWFRVRGFDLVDVMGDKWKRVVLLPIYLLVIVIGYLPTRHQVQKAKISDVERKVILSHLFSPALLFSRSLIAIFKNNSTR